MTAANRMGRPPVSGTTRDAPILVRLTPDERAEVTAAAEARGEAVADMARRGIMREARRATAREWKTVAGSLTCEQSTRPGRFAIARGYG